MEWFEQQQRKSSMGYNTEYKINTFVSITVVNKQVSRGE